MPSRLDPAHVAADVPVTGGMDSAVAGSGRPVPLAARLRLRLFGISSQEADPKRRGFRPASDHVRDRLYAIGQAFLEGYHDALREDSPIALRAALCAVPLERRGFAFEGAAMGWMLRTCLSPAGAHGWAAFAEECAPDHPYMVPVGAGWVLDRLPLPPNVVLRRLDPLLSWLALDGCGFSAGYFGATALLEGRTRAPRRLTGYQCRAFDQGLGRSLWFATGGESAAIESVIGAFAPERRPDLWSGIGLASAYAGGVDRACLDALRTAAAAAGCLSQAAQGAAFAAKARERAGNPTEHTDAACTVLCGMSANAAATITDRALAELSPEDERDGEPRYERWRAAIRAHFETDREGNDA